MSLSEIRAELLVRGFSKPRISQLTRPLRETIVSVVRRHTILAPAPNAKHRSCSIDLVQNIQQEGLTMTEIRAELSMYGFSSTRISQLTRPLRDTMAHAAHGAVAMMRRQKGIGATASTDECWMERKRHRHSMELVEYMQQRGQPLTEIRAQLKQLGYRKARISQLTKPLKATSAGAAGRVVASREAQTGRRHRSRPRRRR